MSKQFFLITLNNDASEYTEADWLRLLSHIRHHEGRDVCWINERCERPDEDGPLNRISIVCRSFRGASTPCPKITNST